VGILGATDKTAPGLGLKEEINIELIVNYKNKITELWE
jgi:hypothetical protein